MSNIQEHVVDVTEDAERRDTYRMSKQDYQRDAQLKIGRKLVEVQVLDESAGGFLISGRSLPKTKPMDTVELFNSNGAHCLRVAWQRKVDGRTRLGLQRLCHTAPEPESPWLFWLVLAVVMGIGVGFAAATIRNPNAIERILNPGRAVVNQTVASPDRH